MFLVDLANYPFLIDFDFNAKYKFLLLMHMHWWSRSDFVMEFINNQLHIAQQCVLCTRYTCKILPTDPNKAKEMILISIIIFAMFIVPFCHSVHASKPSIIYAHKNNVL